MAQLSRGHPDLRRLYRRRCLALLALGLALSGGYGRRVWGEPMEAIPHTTVWPVGIESPTNRSELSSRLAVLGAYLFASAKLSGDGSVACTTCHVPAFGLSGGSPRAVGMSGFVAARRAPPIVNLYDARALAWDGRGKHLEAQIAVPLTSPEMHIDWSRSAAALDQDRRATGLRDAANMKNFSEQEILRALAAYVRSLVAAGSRFDRYYFDHQATLTDAELRGLRLFTRKARCATCHLLDGRAAPLTDAGFHSIGIGFVRGAYRDQGRFLVTGVPSDIGTFKTPTLRDVALRPYLMHDGSMTSLTQVVRYYNRGGIPEAANLDGRVRPLFLSEDEIADLVAFLGTLTSPVLSYQPEAVQTVAGPIGCPSR